MHGPRWIAVLCVATLLAPLTGALGRIQEPTATPTPNAGPQSSSAAPSKPSKTRYSHANDFLIRGTVFDDKALSFAGAQLRIRRAGEKKFRWESYTNARGEFAVRVPQGSNYEMVVRAKGFAEQARTIDAKNRENEESIVFRMERVAGGKK